MIKKWLRKFLKNYLNEKIVNCETCLCLILKSNATKGEPELRKKQYILGWAMTDLITANKDYIHYPYYCKSHIPKNLK